VKHRTCFIFLIGLPVRLDKNEHFRILNFAKSIGKLKIFVENVLVTQKCDIWLILSDMAIKKEKNSLMAFLSQFF
jgi:hypothetical protein